MKTDDITSFLLTIHVGTIIAWFVVISGIITSIVAGTIKLYKLFSSAQKLKNENDEFKNLVKTHDEQLGVIQTSILDIQSKLERQEESEIKKLRYSLIRAMEEYVAKGEITIRQLKSLEENFEEYHSRHQNGYVTTMMRKVRTLPIIGKLDENGTDID